MSRNQVIDGLEPSEEDFAIDKYNLDEAWVSQPDTYRRYAEALADAKQDFELVKNELRLARADVEMRIRVDPEEFGLSKLTEGSVKVAVEQDSAVSKAELAVIDAKHKVNMLEASVAALDHRKRALSDLVSLHLADYFSKPVPREGSQELMDSAMKQKTRRSKRRSKSDG